MPVLAITGGRYDRTNADGPRRPLVPSRHQLASLWRLRKAKEMGLEVWEWKGGRDDGQFVKTSEARPEANP